METARDIALIVIVLEGLVALLAILVLGIIASVTVIELTASVRRGLRRGAGASERLNDRVQDIADERILPTVVRIERARATITKFFERVLSQGASTDRPSDS